jgi:serine protease Do
VPVPIPGRVAEALRQSTVHIETGPGRERGTGSGAVLPSDQIITNAHVLTGGTILVQSWAGISRPASVVKIDRGRDLALLSVPGLQAPSLSLGDSRTVRAGTPVLAIGNPSGFIGAASSGVVHSVGTFSIRNAGPLWNQNEWIAADVRLAPGNSGGPLANLQGQVLGINTMVASGGLAFAIPSHLVQDFLVNDYASRHKLGVNVQPVRMRDGQQGLLILEISSGSAAEAASLFLGDILLAIDNAPLRTPADLATALKRVSESARIRFRRGGLSPVREVTVHLQALGPAQAA